MLKDELIASKMDLWWKMGFAEKTVDLFEKLTWDGVDYGELVDLVHHRIAPHVINQQRIENHVQMATNVARTDVHEDCRSWRGMSLS